MKRLFFAFLSMAGLVLITASSAFATASVSTPANATISADTAGGSYTTLTGPVLTEGANRDVGTGAIVLSAPAGFAYNPAATVSATVTRVSGTTGTLLTLSSGAATVTTTNITITVSAQDQFATSARSILTWSGIQARPTAGTPLSTNNITKASGGATITGITSGTTSFGTLTETAGTANKLGYTTAPAATNTAGVTMASVVVQIQDQFGNRVSSNNVAITVALNTGAFASGTTTVNTGAAGSSTFNNLVMDTAGSYTLTATAAGTSFTATSASAFTIIPAAAGAIQFVQGAPSSVTAGATFSPAVTVKVTDPFSNVISNKTVTLGLNGGGTLSGTVAQVTAGTGVATFSNLSVAQAGSAYSLTASITSPSLSVTDSTFAVTAAAGTQLAYTTAPAATNTAGVTMTSVVVQIQDQFGNSISSNNVPITVALNTGAFASGTTTVNTGAGGSATFNDLVMDTAGSYTLTASAAGTTFTATSASAFTVVPAAASSITLVQDAPSSVTAGATFSPAVTVKLTDSLNNPISNKTVTLGLNGGGTLSGTVAQVTAGTGVATFNNLSVAQAGNAYSLTASITSPSLSVTGSTFVVTTAAATKLVYSTAPVATNTAGVTMPTIVVQIEDQFNNAIQTNGVPIAMALNAGTFASGTTPVNTAPGGSATFSDLVITNAGNNSLTASSAGLTSAASAVTILPGTFVMTFQQDAPSPATAGVTFAPPVAVRIADPFNNVLSNRTVTLSLLGGGTLNGTLSRTTTNTGVATFTNLTVNLVGTSYSLVAASTNSLSVTGATFAVNAAPASKLVYSTMPVTTNTAGQTLPAFVVQIEDQFNNNILTNGVPIAMTLSNGTFASGTTPVNTAVDGSATFNDLVITNAGNNTLTASATGLTSTNKALVILTTGTNSINFIQAPAPSIMAGSVFTNAVKVADLFNNGITNTAVTLTLTGGGSLNGTTVRATAANGVASFTNLNIAVAGTNYAMIASIASPSLSVTSSTFVVTTAAASKLVYTTPPVATNTAGQTLPTFVVQIEDQFNNTIPTNGVPITMTLNTGTFASGTTPVNTAPDGSATFNDLVITNAGNNTLTASATGLASTNEAITILDTAISNIAFIQDAPSVTNAGAVFTPPVTVKVTDSLNNPITNTTVTLSLNGGGTLNGTVSRVTAATGVATFTNLSVNLPGNAYSLTASTTNSLSVTGKTFAITVGAIDHYAVSAATPQTRGVAFNVTVTAQDVVSNTVPDSSTVVTMSGSTANVQFDSNGDGNFGDNTKTLSNGTFTISTEDIYSESITITATDGNAKTGTSALITVNAASGDYRSATNGNWNATATWQTWNGTSWVAASSTPAGGAGTNITIQGTHTVTDNVAVGLTGTLIAQGTASFSTGGSITVGSGGLVLNSGTINSSATTLIFNSGGAYQHDFTTTAGNVPTATWNTGSTCEIVGYTTLDNSGGTPVIGGLNQAFANLTWNCLNQSGTITAQGSLTTVNGNFTLASSGTGLVRLGNNNSGNLVIAGNYSQTGGIFQITGAAARSVTVAGSFSLKGGTFDASSGGNSALNVAGNFSHTGGTLTESAVSSPSAVVVFNGTGIQTYISGGTVSGTVDFNVSNNATLFMGTNFLGMGSSGTFTLSSVGTLGIGDPLGITTSGTSGNIRVSGTRTYSTGANYVYNGPASQVTSNGLPATVSSLTVSNTGGIVTLGATVSVSSNLTVSAGTFDLGSFTANRATSGGTLAVANGAALKIGGTNPFPSNYATHTLGASSSVEYEGSTQNVSAQTYGNLTTSGSSTKTVQSGATTIAGNLTIGSGTTFAAGTNSFSVAGNWSNNGSFTSSGSQTVTFNGSNAQTIDGSSLTTFNDVAINSGSLLDLTFSGSDTVSGLTIAGVNKASGTWGATGSGATHIDNAHFQGTTGTLNVTSGPASATTVATSGNPSVYGQAVTFTATVTGTGPTPTGTVTFMDGANTMGTGTLDGAGHATFTTNTLPVVAHSITAVYGGDDNFGGSTSSALSQTISQAVLTVSGVTAADKFYDGGTTVVLNTGGAALVGVIGNDNVILNTGGASGAFLSKNAGAARPVAVSGLTISGTDSGNYSLTQPTTTANIFALPLTGSITASDKLYDGTPAATISGYGLGGVIGSDNVSLTGGSATFSDKNVGTGKSVTATGLSLTGADAGNYTLASASASTTASINPAPLTVTATGVNKPYDGTTAASVTLSDNRVAGDNFTDSYTAASFSDKTVGSAKPISVTGIAISGADAGNYTANTTASASANILAAQLTGNITASDKVYDGTTAATISGYALIGVIGSDNVSLTGGSATFADQNVGTGKSVTATGLSLTGTDAGNYVLASTTASTTASINPASLTVTADNKSRPYAQPNPPLTASYSGFASGDDTNVLSGAPDLSTTADTNSVPGSYTITVTNGTLSALNYSFSFVNGTLTVGKPQLTVTADDQSRTYGATNPVLTVTYTGFVNGDDTNVLSGLPEISTAADTNSTVAGSPYSITVTNGTLTATNYDFAFVSGSLTVTPAVVTVTADNQTMIYGSVVPTLTASYTGFVNGEDTNVLSGAPELSTTATATSPVAGSPYSITVTNGTLSADNYTFSFVNGQLAVTPATVTGSITASDKLYDGTPAATISGYGLGGVIGSDNVSLTGGSATFSDKNVGTGKSVTATGLSLTGADAGNYTLASASASTTASINPAPLTVTATGVNKPYDGTTAASVTLSDNRVAGDNFTDSYTAASFTDKTVGSAKPISVTGIAISGADAGNYTANTTASASANILAASLTGNITASDKVYDGTTAATISGYALIGVIGSDNVSLTGGSATFADQNVGTGKSVTATGLSLTGTDAGNYALASTTASTTASINPASLTVTADNKSRPYAQPNPPLTASYSGFASGDDTNVLSGAPDLSTTADTNSVPGSYTITVTNGTLSAANYSFSFVNGTLTVGKAQLTVTADDLSRPYGATNPVLTVTYSGFLNGDDTNVLSGLPEISTAADTNSTVAGSPYSITVTNGTLTATNYDFAFVSGSLTVTPAVVTVTADNQTMVYGSVVPTLTASYTGFVNGEDTNVLSGAPELSTTATATSPVAGSPYSITVTNGTLSADNYTFSFVNGQLAVTPATVTGSITASDKLYDGTPAATISGYGLGGVIGSDNVSLTGGSATFSDKNVGTGKSVTATGLSLTGADAGNYTLASASASTTASINPAPLTVTATGVNKPYDGTTAASVTLSDNRVAGDNFTDSYTAASFSDKTVGSAKPISVTGIAISGADAGNYTANTTASASANILAASLTGNITASDKVYDGTTAATISGYALIGVIGSDNVSLTGGSATFADQNVGTGKSVTATGLSLTGTDAGNYALASASASTTANITAVTLTVTADNKSKTVGVSNPTLTATYAGFVNGEDTNVLTIAVSLGTTATDSSPVGTYPITASGGVAPNYIINYTGGTMTVDVMPQLSIVRGGTQVIVTCPATISTQTYQIEYKDDLRDTAWTLLGSPTSGTGGSIAFTNQIATTQRFFRIDIATGQ